MATRLPEWEPCVVLGRPAIFTEERLEKDVEDAIPRMGFELADIRHEECDLTRPIEIKRLVLVNWFGTVVFRNGEMPCPEGTSCNLEPGEFLARDYDWDTGFDDAYKMAEKIEAEVEKGFEDAVHG